MIALRACKLVHRNIEFDDRHSHRLANLAKYRKANEKLKNLRWKQNCTGRDSITEGWTEFNPGFFQKIIWSIADQWSTTPQMLIRFKQDAIHLNPKIIIINGGTNDIWGNTGPSTPDMIIDNLCSMAEIASKNNIQVVLSTILPVYQYPERDDIIDPPKTISFINSVLQDYCKKIV